MAADKHFFFFFLLNFFSFLKVRLYLYLSEFLINGCTPNYIKFKMKNDRTKEKKKEALN